MIKPDIATNAAHKPLQSADYETPYGTISYSEGTAERHSLKALAEDWLPKEAPRNAAELFKIAHEYVMAHPGGWGDEKQLATIDRLTSAVGIFNIENLGVKASSLTSILWRGAEALLMTSEGSSENSDWYITAQVLVGTACALDARLFAFVWVVTSDGEVRP